jgi:hypothetical protein
VSYNAFELVFDVAFIGLKDIANKRRDIRKAYS